MVDTVVGVTHAECDRLIRTTFHKLNVKVWLHTLSSQHHPSSAFYSYHQLHDYLQLTQDALSIRARVTTQHVTTTI